MELRVLTTRDVTTITFGSVRMTAAEVDSGCHSTGGKMYCTVRGVMRHNRFLKVSSTFRLFVSVCFLFQSGADGDKKIVTWW